MNAEPSKCVHIACGFAVVAPCCNIQHGCRACHDESSDHTLGASQISQIACLKCNNVQKISKSCFKCGVPFGDSLCEKCCVSSSSKTRHCFQCGVCRTSDRPFEHCFVCGGCLEVGEHCCLRDALASDCPICAENLFFCSRQVVLMGCGHAMHEDCHLAYMRAALQCPVCHRTCVDRHACDEKIEMILEQEGCVNESLEGLSVELRCFDCARVALQKYTFLFNRCEGCKSFNTTHGEIHREKKRKSNKS